MIKDYKTIWQACAASYGFFFGFLAFWPCLWCSGWLVLLRVGCAHAACTMPHRQLLQCQATEEQTRPQRFVAQVAPHTSTSAQCMGVGRDVGHIKQHFSSASSNPPKEGLQPITANVFLFSVFFLDRALHCLAGMDVLQSFYIALTNLFTGRSRSLRIAGRKDNHTGHKVKLLTFGTSYSISGMADIYKKKTGCMLCGYMRVERTLDRGRGPWRLGWILHYSERQQIAYCAMQRPCKVSSSSWVSKTEPGTPAAACCKAVSEALESA